MRAQRAEKKLVMALSRRIFRLIRLLHGVSLPLYPRLEQLASFPCCSYLPLTTVRVNGPYCSLVC